MIQGSRNGPVISSRKICLVLKILEISFSEKRVKFVLVTLKQTTLSIKNTKKMSNLIYIFVFPLVLYGFVGRISFSFLWAVKKNHLRTIILMSTKTSKHIIFKKNSILKGRENSQWRQFLLGIDYYKLYF